MMLLGDGIVAVCKLGNTNAKGKMPKPKLQTIFRSYFGRKTAGVTRHYAAMAAGNRVDLLIEIPWRKMTAADCYAVIDGGQFRVLQVQNLQNEDGQRMADLTLQKLEDYYDVET